MLAFLTDQMPQDAPGAGPIKANCENDCSRLKTPQSYSPSFLMGHRPLVLPDPCRLSQQTTYLLAAVPAVSSSLREASGVERTTKLDRWDASEAQRFSSPMAAHREHPYSHQASLGRHSMQRLVSPLVQSLLNLKLIMPPGSCRQSERCQSKPSVCKRSASLCADCERKSLVSLLIGLRNTNYDRNLIVASLPVVRGERC